MRTKEQIKNLRMVFTSMFGPVGLILSDEDIIRWDENINRWGDMILKQVDEVKYMWNVKIKTSDNKDRDWNEIEPEPTLPYASEKVIQEKAISIINKYPSILEIELTNSMEESHRFLISKQ